MNVTLKRFAYAAAFHVYALMPFLYEARKSILWLNFIRGPLAYRRDWKAYDRLHRAGDPFELGTLDARPFYYDRYDESGSMPKHYFQQDLWAARKVFQSGVKTHYDIGSRIDGFVAHCLAFCDVVEVDVRPLTSSIPGLTFVQGDATKLEHIANASLHSVSTLHAIEHFGLGRYGDPVDPSAHLKAVAELRRIVAPGGTLYLGTPVGRQRLEFNGQRIFDPRFLADLLAPDFDIVEFSVIDDHERFVENADIEAYRTANNACGLFHLRKK